MIYLLLTGVLLNGNIMLFDFNSASTSGNWQIINDGVMGGLSNSKLKFNEDSTATFFGKVLPDNNGGFASVRAAVESEPDKDLSGVIIKVKGDGQIYNLRFRTNNRFDGASYQAKFKTEKDTWKEYKIPFSDFIPTFRGRTLYNQPKLEPQNIRQVGILIADKQFGEFEMHIDWIKFY